jgi:hypothetical protein
VIAFKGMNGPGFPTARAVAPRIKEHFIRYLAAGVPGAPPAPLTEDIEAVIDAGFWASLKREEGYIPKISLALVPPEAVTRPMFFAHPLTLDPQKLVRLAPAVERPGIHLGVWRREGRLEVWGTTRSIPRSSFVLEVAAPGLLVVKHHRGDAGKYINVAVLEGDQIKLIDEHASTMPDCPAMLSSLLGFSENGTWNGSVDVLVDLAVSMRGHGRGGIILIVPGATETWTESIVQPIPYAVLPPYTGLTDLLARDAAERGERAWDEELEDTVNAIAGLTAVDGATILNDRCELLAFGAKITRRKGWAVVEQAAITEPIEGGEAAVVSTSQLGGTRHLSAAQFVHDQRDALALVASQDGRFTMFAWSACEERVHAHRVETLLL